MNEASYTDHAGGGAATAHLAVEHEGSPRRRVPAALQQQEGHCKHETRGNNVHDKGLGGGGISAGRCQLEPQGGKLPEEQLQLMCPHTLQPPPL